MFEDTNQAENFAEDTNQQEEGLLPFSLFEHEEEQQDEFTVKYNGEEKKLTLSEAKTLAQKGMNYDHVLSQREDAHRALDALATREGLTRAELISKIGGEDINKLRWNNLLKAYPDLQVEKIPREVFLQINDGISPLEAYQSHLISELNQKLATKEQARVNSERAIGSLQSDGDGYRDSFLEGFYGAKY